MINIIDKISYFFFFRFLVAYLSIKIGLWTSIVATIGAFDAPNPTIWHILLRIYIIFSLIFFPIAVVAVFFLSSVYVWGLFAINMGIFIALIILFGTYDGISNVLSLIWSNDVLRILPTIPSIVYGAFGMIRDNYIW